MVLRDVFDNRSGRVIAVFRAVLALVFVVALLFEPSSGPDVLARSRMLLTGYFVIGLGLIAVAWRSWWYDYQLALPVLLLDISLFLAAVFLTEASDSDFTSPFLAIFALIVLSTTLRWDWRRAAAIGVLVTVVFLPVGLLISHFGVAVDHYRLWRRAFYMLALLLVLVWFGIQRRAPQVMALEVAPEAQDAAAFTRQAITYARNLTGASRAILAWNPLDEPWTEVYSELGNTRSVERHAPDEERRWMPDDAELRLFHAPLRRKLVLGLHDRPRPAALRSQQAAAGEIALGEGLSLPIRGALGEGLLVLGGIAHPGADFLLLGQAVAREIGSAFDRFLLGQLEREALVARTRSAIARDLHDSVAQSLAGACFRLEALRRNFREAKVDGTEAEHEVLSVRDALRREQAHVRGLIDALRVPAQPPRSRNLREDLDLTLSDAGAHWGIEVALDAPGTIDVPGSTSHEIQQLVREAVANAARHGHARRLTTRVTLASSGVVLQIEDNGRGFATAGQPDRPWSISERVDSLGGQLQVDSSPAGTSLRVTLPLAPDRI